MFRNILVISICSIVGWQVYSLGASPAKPQKVLTRADYRRPAATPYPAGNSFSEAKHDLGRSLFYDPALSGSLEISCATCHVERKAWTDGRPRAVGAANKPLPFKSPTLLDVAWLDLLGWDGKFATLEDVAFTPILGKANMNNTEAVLIERLKASPEYTRQFAAAFVDGSITRSNIEKALATYERSIVSPEAPFDRWVGGDEGAVNVAAKRGFDVFNGKAACAQCHAGWSFTDGGFHDIGTARGEDVGRGRYFKEPGKLQYAYKTPTLREVTKRAPYMHDGSIASLEKVIDHYDNGGIERPSRAAPIKPLHLTAMDKADLIEFLKTLSAE